MAGADRPERRAAGIRHGRYAAGAAFGEHALHRADNAGIAGAAAEIAAHGDADVLFARLVEPRHHVARGDEHARRAVAALQRMLAREGGAQFAGDLVIVDGEDQVIGDPWLRISQTVVAVASLVSALIAILNYSKK